MDLQELSDRIEIADLLTRYADAVDRRDWDQYRSVFTPDARIDYTSVGGVAGPVAEVCDWLAEALVMFESTQHMISNVSVELDGDTAAVTAMVFNPMKFPDGSMHGTVWSTGGWYHHKLVRTPDGWRSRELREEASWFQGLPQNPADPEPGPDRAS